MTTINEIARLRLAARMLVEFGTPATTQQYQQVVRDLLAHHSFTNSTPTLLAVLALDKDGSLLWYLSETLGKDQVVVSPAPDPDLLLDTFVQFILDAVTEKKRDAVLWMNGASMDTIADGIISAILSDDLSMKEFGIRSLVALHVPWPKPSLKDSVDSLLSAQKGTSSLVRRLTRSVRLFYKGSQTSLTALTSISVLGLIVMGLVSGFGLPVSLVIVNILVTLLGPILKKILSSYQVQFKGLVVRLYSNATIAGGMPEVLEYRDQFAPVLRDPVLWKRSLEEFLGYKAGILKSMLRQTNIEWGMLALSCTPEASALVVREALQVLRVPETSGSLRAEIFGWLCRVGVSN